MCRAMAKGPETYPSEIPTDQPLIMHIDQPLSGVSQLQ